MVFSIDLETMESHLFDDYNSNQNTVISIGLRKNSLLLAIVERLEVIAIELEKKNG